MFEKDIRSWNKEYQQIKLERFYYYVNELHKIVENIRSITLHKKIKMEIHFKTNHIKTTYMMYSGLTSQEPEDSFVHNSCTQ